jgi:hypothetical protein
VGGYTDRQQGQQGDLINLLLSSKYGKLAKNIAALRQARAPTVMTIRLHQN